MLFIHVIRLALERDKRTDEHANTTKSELGIESDVVIRCSIYSTVACGCETDNWLVACTTNQKKKKGIPRIIISAMNGYMNNAILCKRILIYLFVVVKRLIMLMFMIVVMMLNWLNRQMISCHNDKSFKIIKMLFIKNPDSLLTKLIVSGWMRKW